MKPIYKLLSLLLLSSAIFTTGCQVNVYDPPPPPPPRPCHGIGGYDGYAFLALDYEFVAPSYIWGDNPFIPERFIYGDYYTAAAGIYELYYEGEMWDGPDYIEYGWEVEYQIWIHPGGAPSCYHNGNMGPDSYLAIILGPYGPILDRMNRTSSPYWEITRTGENITAIKETTAYKVKATYKKVTPTHLKK